MRALPDVAPLAKGFRLAVDRVAVRASIRTPHPGTKRFAQVVIDQLREEIASDVRKKGRFEWPGLGTFYLRRSKRRRITNPITGEPMMLGARWSIGFRASKSQKGEGRGP